MENINVYNHGRMNFMAGMCRKINIDKIFNESLQSENGRRPDISYGTQALMMIVNIVDNKVPLYRMKEYYSDYIDFEGIFKEEIYISMINDDRFGNFLDKFYEANPRGIFSRISAYAFAVYDIKVKNINYDTTSKVMWGEYDGYDGKHGEISITFGHSKDKRNDKKQIKIGAGVAEGIMVDAEVLSGNTDDKTYNFNNLDEVGNVKFMNAQNKDVEYLIKDCYFNYKGTNCKGALCYSKSLESTKTKSALKKVEAENEVLNKTKKKCSKMIFETEKQALIAIDEIRKNQLKNIVFHEISFNLNSMEKKKPGRPSKEEHSQKVILEYAIEIEFNKLETIIEEHITKSCMFLLGSNDLEISAYEILKEYKTQSCVEKKFQQFKSSEFVDSLFLKTPQRIESLTYMMLISMMVLSIVEYVTRREMESNDITIIGPGGIKMKRPTLNSILIVMKTVPVMVIGTGNSKERKLIQAFSDSQNCILRCLGLGEEMYI